MLGSDLKQQSLLGSFAKTAEVLEAGISEQVAPGFVAGVWRAREPDQIWVGALGQRRLEPTRQKMLVETVFDLASLTKIVATTTLTALFVQRGWLKWDTSVRSILPDFRYAGIEIRHLMSHTSGQPAWLPFFEQMKKELGSSLYRYSIDERKNLMRTYVFNVVPGAAPGKKCVYSDLTFMTLGFVLEKNLRYGT